MALLTCKECEAQVSSKATSCPKCGAPIKQQISGFGCLVALLLAVVIFLITAAISDLDTSNNPQKTMSVAVSWGNTYSQIKIIGSSYILGKDVEVYLNDMPPFTYKAVCIGPGVGKTVRVPLNTFVKEDGLRFNPKTHAVSEVWIGGAGYDYIKFR